MSRVIRVVGLLYLDPELLLDHKNASLSTQRLRLAPRMGRGSPTASENKAAWHQQRGVYLGTFSYLCDMRHTPAEKLVEARTAELEPWGSRSLCVSLDR